MTVELETPIDQDEPVATQATNAPLAEENSSTPGPRLAIKKMVLNNFKSYAGRVDIGPFHKVNGTAECTF